MDPFFESRIEGDTQANQVATREQVMRSQYNDRNRCPKWFIPLICFDGRDPSDPANVFGCVYFVDWGFNSLLRDRIYCCRGLRLLPLPMSGRLDLVGLACMGMDEAREAPLEFLPPLRRR